MDLDPRLEAAFSALREEGAATPRPEAMASARAAMHRAVAEAPRRGRLALLAARLRDAATPMRLAAGSGGVVAGIAVVLGLGWNAPAGTPLHGVRVAHEQIAMVLPGSDRVGLDLAYAESRLRDAEQGTSTIASLDEAGRLLDDAHSHLAGGSADWNRWRGDEALLESLRGEHESGTPGAGAAGSGSDEGGATGGGGASTASGGDDRGTTSSTSTSTAGEGGGTSTQSEHEGGTSSTTTTTRSTTSSTSADGGEGGSSSTSTSSSSTSGGGGGSDGSAGTADGH